MNASNNFTCDRPIGKNIVKSFGINPFAPNWNRGLMVHWCTNETDSLKFNSTRYGGSKTPDVQKDVVNKRLDNLTCYTKRFRDFAEIDFLMKEPMKVRISNDPWILSQKMLVLMGELTVLAFLFRAILFKPKRFYSLSDRDTYEPLCEEIKKIELERLNINQLEYKELLKKEGRQKFEYD